MHAACNWAQVLEGSIDSAHSSSLHSSNMPAMGIDGAKATETVWPRPSTDKSPRIQVQQTDWGFRYAAIRKPILNPDTHDYVRTTLFIAPFTVLIPPNDQYKLAQMLVPIDDANTMFYWVAWHEAKGKGIDQESWRKFCAAEVGVDLDQNYRKLRNLENRFLQDRDAMKRGDFTGIAGIPAQDMAMWESMGRDRRPHQGLSGRERSRRGAVPPPDGGGGQAHARRRPGDRHDRAAHAAGEARLVRGYGCEEDRLAHARRVRRRKWT